MTNSELYRGVRRKDRDALAELLFELNRRVWFPFYDAAPGQRAEDLLLALFMAVVKAIQRREVPDPEEIWIYAHREAHRLLREAMGLKKAA